MLWGYTLGFLLSFLLVEPKIDSVKFSFRNYLIQTGQGLKQLFRNTNIKWQTILLLSIGFITVISSEMVDSFVSFEFGFTDKQMGILWSVIFVISAFASQLTNSFKKALGINRSVVMVGILMALTLIVSPYIGLAIGGLSLILRSSLQSVFGNLSSVEINNSTDSEYRATTLSTFNMIKNIPYVLSAYFIGSISDFMSAKTVSLYLGIALIGLLGVNLIRSKRNVTIEA